MPTLKAINRATILIVEDHAATRRAVVALFDGALLDGILPACRLLAVDSAEGALSLCAKLLGADEAPAIVIMDISLPGMNGIEATQRIRAQFPQVQVIMHSSNDMQVYRDEAAAVGACAFVSKGRTSSELIALVSRLLPGAA
jgi:DNA-binding NarL/FixJ family response regulator